MLGVKVAFKDTEAYKEVVITRPFFTFGMPLILALMVASYFLHEANLAQVTLWAFLVYVNLRNAEECIRIQGDEVQVRNGIWLLALREAFKIADISRVHVSSARSSDNRGVVGFYSPLNLTVHKRRRDFLRGASIADAKVVARWLEDA